MNNRVIQKSETRKNILMCALDEFVENGFLNTTTKTIADKAGVAHGTLFLHFENKDILIRHVLEEKLLDITQQLDEILSGISQIKALLNCYLDFIQSNEDFYSVLNKELPFYEEPIRSEIFLKESSVRNYFYEAINSGIADGRYKEVDITMAITFLFGTINYLLANSDCFTDGKIFEFIKQSIIDTFMQIIEKKES